MKKILLIEDDHQVCAIVKKGLEEENFEVTIATDGDTGLSMASEENYDLMILDIMLPKKSGLEVCTRIRHTSNIPILLLTALGTAENVAEGLNRGADDYLVKPFKFIELIARINSLLRRAGREEEKSEVYKFSGVVLNNTSKTVTVNDQEVALTSTEFKLLLLLMKMPNKVYSRQEILERVWEVNFDLGTNVVDVYINYLRKKLDKHGSPKIIHTVVGMGYVLREK
ncbi:response regulator transcription factor [Leadbetterella byssophila]|uniref:response regulator transcription factor n=1 Tax=Leadbetterella byssophila TaxID=316068 RepID=UPI0039A00E0F